MKATEIYNRNLLYVLEKIKKGELHSQWKNRIIYSVSFNKSDGPSPLPADEIAVLKKLAIEHRIIRIDDGIDEPANALEKATRRAEEIIATVEDEIETIEPSQNKKRVRIFSVEILHPQFEKFYNLQHKRISETAFKPVSASDIKIGKIKSSRKTVNEKMFYITERDGEFYFNGKPLNMGHGTIYKDIVGLCIESANQNNEVFYDQLNVALGKTHGEVTERKKAVKRIQNAIRSLHRFARVGGGRLKKRTSDGRDLFEFPRKNNDYLIFNNNKH